MISRLTSLILLAVIALLSGCLGTVPTENPLPFIATRHSGAQADAVVVMLPGRGDRGNTLIKNGFHEAGRRHGLDTIAVDAHFGYYRERSLLPRLHEDVILSAHEAGYKKVWLLGISMGGFGSLLYAAQHPDLVDGVILLAPFLGEQEAIEQIGNDGSLRGWGGKDSGLQDYEVAIWSWLRDATTGADKSPLILGFGLSDPMAAGYALLTDAMEPSSVYTLEGGHKWTTWGPLWDQIAANLEL